MNFLYALAIALSASPAFALDFQFNKDHCASGEYQPVNPQSGGQSHGFLDSSAWAETGVCVRIPIERLEEAAGDLGVMTWAGTTKILGVTQLPLPPQGLFHLRVSYEARHKHIWCQTAQWPLEWTAAVTAPTTMLITMDRVSGGDSNGAYIKQFSARIELVRASAGETSVHMRYEVKAPSQTPAGAVGAVTDYVNRLSTVSKGGHAPGPVVDPDCR